MTRKSNGVVCLLSFMAGSLDPKDIVRIYLSYMVWYYHTVFASDFGRIYSSSKMAKTAQALSTVKTWLPRDVNVCACVRTSGLTNVVFSILPPLLVRMRKLCTCGGQVFKV